MELDVVPCEMLCIFESSEGGLRKNISINSDSGYDAIKCNYLPKVRLACPDLESPSTKEILDLWFCCRFKLKKNPNLIYIIFFLGVNVPV